MTTVAEAQRAQKRAERVALEEIFVLHCRAHRISGYLREHQFHPERKWRLDFAWPWVFKSGGIALEIEGGIWREKGAHNTGLAISRDIEKGNAALELGWAVYRATAEMVKSGQAIELIKRALSHAKAA